MEKPIVKKITLEAQLNMLLVLAILGTLLTVSILYYFVNDMLLSILFTVALVLPANVIILHYYMSPINRMLAALYSGMSNFLDNDFSISLAKKRQDELGDLIEIYNRVGTTLRNERVHLYQRELLLDTVMQSTPLSLVLTDDSGKIIYNNSSARQLFNHGRSLNGFNFTSLLDTLPKPFKQSLKSGLSGLFTVIENNENETYYLTQNKFLLNGKQHLLYLFKRLTKEINRQEVNTWKKVIRLISHELNNSLAPISSLSHSGKLLSTRLQVLQLQDIFETIEERSNYLKRFIEGYAEYARLPKPVIEKINAYSFFSSLQNLHSFTLQCQHDNASIHCDPAQLQQVMINLLKNSHESGSDTQAILVEVRNHADSTEIKIKDRGCGMPENTIRNALLPFYSTKARGSGLGLPLCREIIEAHGGKILIQNRKNKGLGITLFLPNIKSDFTTASDPI